MKPITFENLRRLMGGGRKKKDRSESSFKRSDSFKRISIKRNYLERGGRARVPHPPTAAGAKGKALLARASSRSPSPSLTPPPPASPPPAPPPDPHVIGYGQWIRCQLQSNSSSSDERAPTPPPRRRGSSIAADASLEIIRLDRSPVVARRRPCPGTASVMSPGGGGGSGGGSSGSAAEKDAETSRPDSAISVNLGRVWLDAPMAMAPRSLELPRPPQPALGGPPAPPPGGPGRRAHHSLDSALKESRRFLTPRALSSQARDSRITSSKDSGFSFSISIPRLADVSPTSLSPPPGAGVPEASGGGGFFRRKKKLSKPSPSVSRDGYFKRTSCASLTSTGSASGGAAAEDVPGGGVRRGSSRRKKGGRGPGPGATVASRGSLRGSTRGSTRGSGRRKKLPQMSAQVVAAVAAVPACGAGAGTGTGTVRSDIYQVVVGRAPRSLHALKLDPMIFVAPEKRKPSSASNVSARRPPHRYEVQEIRGPFVPRDPAADMTAVPAARDDTEEDEGLYECISPPSAGSLRASSVESLDRLDSEPERAAEAAAEEVEAGGVAAPRRPSVTIKTKRNHVTKVMINMPSDRSSSDADSEDDVGSEDDDDDLRDEGYAPPGFSPVPRCRSMHPGARRPVQRRKSARRNVKYLAKPNIHRAPSTLRRARKCEYAALQRRLVAALDTPVPAAGPLTAHAPRTRSTRSTPDSESDGEWI